MYNIAIMIPSNNPYIKMGQLTIPRLPINTHFTPKCHLFVSLAAPDIAEILGVFYAKVLF